MTWLNDEERRLNKLSADALAVGVGTAWRAPIPAAGLFFNEAGAEMHWLMPGAHADSAWAASEVYGTFIGGFLRVSVRLDTHRFLREPRFISTTFSLSDLGGLAYWIMRSAR
jgi:hypothetical protein